MRLWDCDPRLLTRKHLGGEWNELHQMLTALAKLDRGEKGGWQNHTETRRFIGLEHLILGRRHFIQQAASERGFSYTVRPQVPDVWWDRLTNAADPCDYDFWLDWAFDVHWPWSTDERARGAADPLGPWHRDGVDYSYYRLEGPYADGILALLP